MSTTLLLILLCFISTTMLIVDILLTVHFRSRAKREAWRADFAVRENDFLKISRDTWRSRALRADARDFPDLSTSELERMAHRLANGLYKTDAEDRDLRRRDCFRDELLRVRAELLRRRAAKVVFA